jgi:hypothetical protein
MRTLTYLVTIILILGVILFYFYHREGEDLKIITFETKEAQYDIDGDIAFRVQVNKRAYIYLYTYDDKSVRKLLYPKSFSESHMLGANQIGLIDNFNIKPKDGERKEYKDEKVLLIVAVNLLSEAKKEMSHKSFAKMLEGNQNTSMTIVKGEQEQKYKFIIIPIRKPKQKVTIETESTSYMEDEDIDLDINSLHDGYVWVFEATPTENIKRLKSGKIDSNSRFPTGTTAHKPIGYHTAIVIYTKENRPIESDDFTIIKGKSIKGEPNFKVKFKNGKSYTYDIETFKVTE